MLFFFSPLCRCINWQDIAGLMYKCWSMVPLDTPGYFRQRSIIILGLARVILWAEHCSLSAPYDLVAESTVTWMQPIPY